ncbi:hypothetical protein IX95_12210 [Vibrio sp. B183]|nr:hypothetical protein IX95_12210 [Vibrio sp. B183]
MFLVVVRFHNKRNILRQAKQGFDITPVIEHWRAAEQGRLMSFKPLIEKILRRKYVLYTRGRSSGLF